MSYKKEKMIIIGGGCAGLTAAIYAGRAGLNPVVAMGNISKENQPGGQLLITTDVENYPGFPEGIQGPELVDKLNAQAIKFGARLVPGLATLADPLKKLTPNGPFYLKIGDELYETESIICANGASAKWLHLENEHKYMNNGISACATCDGPLPIFRNKEIYVIGGGDSAMEEALFLTRFASKVIVIHRRDKLRASKIMQERALENPKIEFMWNTVITKYLGETYLEGLILKNIVTNEYTQVKTPGLFMAIGHNPNTKTLVGSGLELDDAGYIKVHDQVHTNINGVFACGDVHDLIYKQAITAAGFGCMAAISAERWLEIKK